MARESMSDDDDRPEIGDSDGQPVYVRVANDLIKGLIDNPNLRASEFWEMMAEHMPYLSPRDLSTLMSAFNLVVTVRISSYTVLRRYPDPLETYVTFPFSERMPDWPQSGPDWQLNPKRDDIDD